MLEAVSYILWMFFRRISNYTRYYHMKSQVQIDELKRRQELLSKIRKASEQIARNSAYGSYVIVPKDMADLLNDMQKVEIDIII